MARISKSNLEIFSEASKTILDNFTDEELRKINGAAAVLKVTLWEAEKRQREKVSNERTHR